MLQFSCSCLARAKKAGSLGFPSPSLPSLGAAFETQRQNRGKFRREWDKTSHLWVRIDEWAVPGRFILRSL